ncbi:kinesin-like protein KIF13A [Harpia harpyja]|uniref:kinesin-like protein KIF13A n=1 Tax=Harpia harpyja TaxID=202280 RepID=UPI0022B0CFEB|nr:kinesin-like protein KIF13A [Harpia harpyja]
MSDTKVKVAVRVRPMNRRELDLNTKCIVEMEGNQTVLHPPPSNSKQGESISLWNRPDDLHNLFRYLGKKHFLTLYFFNVGLKSDAII